tara:strand:+ start:776 stop:1408 length:633 start_codon:yes stop_codon:yes gene_type:complete
MSWLATAVTVGTSAYSIYSSYQSGKAQKRQLEKQAEATMLTALKRISDRTTKSIYDKWEVANTGGEAIISNYIASNKNIQDNVAEASGSGAVISGTVTDVKRSQEVQQDAVQVAINNNTQKNIEGITRDTNMQNEADYQAAKLGYENLNSQANDVHKANQRQVLAGILQTAAAGYSTHAKVSSSKPNDTAFWNKDWASWDQIKAGQFTLG